MAKYLTVAETAKLVRKALKAEFPAVTFAVRSKSYSGGASVSVNWVDGPTEEMVKRVVARFEGAEFDAMIDLKSYRVGELDGEEVHFGADWVFVRRGYSAAMSEHVARLVAKKWGCRVATFRQDAYGSMDAESASTRVDNAGGEFLPALWHREAHDLARTPSDEYVRVRLR